MSTIGYKIQVNRMNTNIIIAIIAVAAIAGVGGAYVIMSGGDSSSAEKAQNIACEPYSVTDLAGQEYTFDHTFGAVAVQWSISGGPFITMAALLGDKLPDYLVGIDTTPSAYRADSWNEFCKQMPALKDLVCYGDCDNDWDTTKALTLKPNALIASKDMKTTIESKNIDKDFKDAGIPVIYIDFHSQDVTKSAASIRLLGKIFGVSERAEQLATMYETKCNAVYSQIDALITANGGRISVYNETPMYSPAQFGKSRANNQMMGQLLYNCGGNNINETSGNLDSAKVLSSDPEKIFFFGSYWPDNPDSFRVGFGVTDADINASIEKYFTDRDWKSLRSYTSGEVYGMGMCLTRDVYDFCSLEYIAKALWPTAFSSLDPVKDLQDFYKDWMPFDYSGTWYHKLELAA